MVVDIHINGGFLGSHGAAERVRPDDRGDRVPPALEVGHVESQGRVMNGMAAMRKDWMAVCEMYFDALENIEGEEESVPGLDGRDRMPRAHGGDSAWYIFPIEQNKGRYHYERLSGKKYRLLPHKVSFLHSYQNTKTSPKHKVLIPQLILQKIPPTQHPNNSTHQAQADGMAQPVGRLNWLLMIHSQYATKIADMERYRTGE